MNSLLKKVELYGEKSLSDLEILFILFGKRNVKKIMVLYENVFNDYGKYSNMYELTTNELVNTYGFSNNESLKFRVICEFAKRFNKTLNLEKRIIKSSKDINDIFASEFIYEKDEILKLIVLNNKNIIKRVIQITNGKQNSVTFDIKSILLEAIKTGYNKIILVHNHPSGDPTPSEDDLRITKRVEKGAQILQLELVDHIIIGDNTYFSFKENELIN